jgi:hypothetical protein
LVTGDGEGSMSFEAQIKVHLFTRGMKLLEIEQNIVEDPNY